MCLCVCIFSVAIINLCRTVYTMCPPHITNTHLIPLCLPSSSLYHIATIHTSENNNNYKYIFFSFLIINIMNGQNADKVTLGIICGVYDLDLICIYICVCDISSSFFFCLPLPRAWAWICGFRGDSFIHSCTQTERPKATVWVHYIFHLDMAVINEVEILFNFVVTFLHIYINRHLCVSPAAHQTANGELPRNYGLSWTKERREEWNCTYLWFSSHHNMANSVNFFLFRANKSVIEMALFHYQLFLTLDIYINIFENWPENLCMYIMWRLTVDIASTYITIIYINMWHAEIENVIIFCDG